MCLAESKREEMSNQLANIRQTPFQGCNGKSNLTAMEQSVKKPAGNEAGLTLIELVVVIFFTSVALTALLNSFNVSITKSTDSEALTIAVELAEEKLEEIRSDKDGRGYPFIISDNYPEEVDPDGYANFTRTVSIVPHTDYKNIYVTVSNPKIPNVQLATILANY